VPGAALPQRPEQEPYVPRRYWRQLLPREFRYRRAMLWVERAEQQEELADRFAGEPLEDRYAQNAIGFYLNAWKWRPVATPHEFPSPENLGEHHVDEQIWPEGTADMAEEKLTIACIICGKPIKARLKGEAPGAGMYCERCKG
jgi:hypothetical protein